MPYNQPDKNRKAVMTVSDKRKYDCTTCPYPRYKDGSVIFCDVCIRRILDEQKEERNERSNRMREEKRMLGNYEVVNSIYIGDKEVVFGVDKSDKYPFL